MKAMALTPTTTYNVGRLMCLPRLEKLRLIAVLTDSLMKSESETNTAENWADRFCGAWKDDRSAEEIIADIRESRTANRDIVSLFEE